MLKKITVIFLVVIIMVLPLSIFASAAGSSFSTSLLPITSFTDMLGYRHDYFFIFGDSNGLIIEYKYKPSSLTLSLNLTNSDLSYTAISPSGTSTLEIFYRDLYSGRYLDDNYINVTSEYSYSYKRYYNTLDSSSTLYPYSFSNFHYYDVSDGFETSFYVNATSFYPGTVVFIDSSSSFLVSPLPEPVFDNYNYYIVFQGGNRAILMQIYFDFTAIPDSASYKDDFSFYLNVLSSGKYQLCIENPFILSDGSYSSFYMYFSLYDISTGFYLSSGERHITRSGVTTANLSTTVYDFPKVKTYGLGFINTLGFSVSLPDIVWNYNDIIPSSITAQTLLLYSQLLQINNGIDLIEDTLYGMLGSVIGSVDDIYDLLEDIYHSDGDSFSDPPTEALSDFYSDESAVYDVLPSNMTGNIDIALGSGNVDFSGNGAFGLIRSLMQNIAFTNSKISGFILFSLGIGIATLVLGRKLNNA